MAPTITRAARRANVSLSPAMALEQARSSESSSWNDAAERYRVCAKVVAKMTTTSGYCTRLQVRARIRRLERRFRRAHGFSISHAGFQLFFRNKELFFQKVSQMCPHYMKLFPVLIRHLNDLEETDDDDDSSVESCEQADSFVNGMHERGGACEEDAALLDNPESVDSREQAKELELRQFFYQEGYLKIREKGFTDRKIFRMFPEFILAEFPTK